MPKLPFRFWVVAYALSLITGQSYAEEYFAEDYCMCAYEEVLAPNRLRLSHTEGSGLGYMIGYTSVDLFVSKPLPCYSLVPFADLRGHFFNNGMTAANAGIGLRYLNDCYQQIWGVNVIYDFLQNTRKSYNQVGAGLEIIGQCWDFHLNAYVPVGDKRRNIYRFSYDFYDALRNDNFSNFRFGLRAREQMAMNGVDALFGYRFCNYSLAEIHLSAGPYYYWGSTAKTQNAFNSTRRSAAGGRVLADIIFKRYFVLSGVVTYDPIFKWCGQATIALNIPFDFNFQDPQCGCPSCSLRSRLFDNIVRNEIIAVDHVTRFTDDPRVLDPEFQP